MNSIGRRGFLRHRNSELYGSYTAEALNGIYMLARREHIHLAGVVTWAFEFESQPYFEGFRELATNGLDKPVLNTFRMLGLLGGERVKVFSSGALPVESVLRSGVREQPDVSVIAARKDHEIEVLMWNYHGGSALRTNAGGCSG
jgi:xylan 1,4-beta-xylosidase